jgi:hypothetical protein
MKSVLVAITFVLSSSVFAARLPTVNESISIENSLKKSSSIRDIINLINNNKIDPFYRDAGMDGYVASPGQSMLATALLKDRMKLDAPLGSQSENLELLALLIKKGLNLNIMHEEFSSSEKKSLLNRASSECATSAIDLLISKGADQAFEDFYWLNSLYKSFDYDAGSINDTKCSGLVLKFLDSAKGISLETAYRFLSGGYNLTNNPFLNGSMLAEFLSEDIKAKLHDSFGIIKPSTRPSKVNLGEQWFKNFKDRFGQPTSSTDVHGSNFYLNWWPQYSAIEKAWACYFSSFDEMYPLLKDMGLSDDQIMHQPLTSKYAAEFGEFAVKVFVPYCNSIRD